MSSSKNSLYSNFMETGITVLCKTGKNKIKKFNIKQGYCHNTRIWNSTFYSPMGYCRYLFSWLCYSQLCKSKNMKPKIVWNLRLSTFTKWHTSKGISSRAKIAEVTIPTYKSSFQPYKPIKVHCSLSVRLFLENKAILVFSWGLCYKGDLPTSQ